MQVMLTKAMNDAPILNFHNGFEMCLENCKLSKEVIELILSFTHNLLICINVKKTRNHLKLFLNIMSLDIHPRSHSQCLNFTKV